MRNDRTLTHEQTDVVRMISDSAASGDVEEAQELLRRLPSRLIEDVRRVIDAAAREHVTLRLK